MSTIDLCKDWKIRRLGDENYIIRDIPFDAMMLDKRVENAKTGKNECWIEASDYAYQKSFKLDESYKDKKIYIDFEGIYRNAQVLLNGKELNVLPYGYSESIVDITELLDFENENRIDILAKNADQPNSRWYTGTGVIRPVSLIVYPKEHILLNSIILNTLSHEDKLVNVRLKTTNVGCVSLSIYKKEKEIYHFDFESNGEVDENIFLPKLDLWSIEKPNLYEFKFQFNDHIETIKYGLRTINASTEGFFVNGERVVLKGACIHSDAQTLGSVTSKFIETRKVKMLKEVGYNAIRSAHNPICKYMLEACDEFGMIIMDEYVDCWYFKKTLYDYTGILHMHWKDDIKSMIMKDINHPSVMIYSLGNEVGETAQDKGVKLLRDFIEYTKELDPTRPLTCGVNIVFNGMVKLGFGFYNEDKAKKELEKNNNRKQKVGSELFNDLTNALGGKILKQGASLPVCDRATRKPFEILDMAGYNYGIKRYKHDLKKYPNRIILGSETFCSDAREFILLNKKYPRIAGDFVWAGLDYLGEVAVGSRVDSEHCDNIMSGGLGWMSAGSGRINIIGEELGEALYTKVAFEKEVVKMATYSPKHRKMKHSVSSWKMSVAMPFYSYEGYENKTMPLEIYSVGHHYELFQNDKLIKKGKCNKFAVNKLNIKYIPGTLKVVVYDKNNNVLGTDELKSAKTDELKLTINLEQKEIKENELIYAHIKVTDNEGIIKPLEERLVHVEVENGELLSLASGNSYNKEGFMVDTAKTYFGTCLAIIKPTNKEKVTINATTEDLKNKIVVKVK